MIDQISQLLHHELSRKSRQVAEKVRAESALTGRTRQQEPKAADPNAVLRARIDHLKQSGVVETPVLIRAAVEYMLKREFGDRLANLSSFQEMTDWVTAVILDDPASRSALADLLKL
ncbi:hypothetical protein [Burkholderia sp. BCC1977]|uniref:hypothetical protein n=1 Tax=Burkholderia sp. BCC1977 TaxID=2817440 RepID=UPI002ABD6200|nr:hypothetical protein [Burkholderia sp. BCC1977]